MDERRQSQGEAEDDEEGDYDVGEAFGDHNIEYWVYDGRRLVPASADEEERLRDWWAQRRMQTWHELEQRRAHIATQRARWARLRAGLAATCVWIPRLLARTNHKSARDALAAAGNTQHSEHSASGASEGADT